MYDFESRKKWRIDVGKMTVWIQCAPQTLLYAQWQRRGMTRACAHLECLWSGRYWMQVRALAKARRSPQPIQIGGSSPPINHPTSSGCVDWMCCEPVCCWMHHGWRTTSTAARAIRGGCLGRSFQCCLYYGDSISCGFTKICVVLRTICGGWNPLRA